LYLRDCGDTEVGGFGISAAGDLLAVEDVQLVKQSCTSVSVAFQDESVADFFDAQVDRGLKPEQFARIWVHTHPGDNPQPSMTDEDTFERVFGRSDWALMFILARGGQTYARLRFNIGPGGELKIPVDVDFRQPFNGSDDAAWEQEYLANVQGNSRPGSEPPASQKRLDSSGVIAVDKDEVEVWERALAFAGLPVNANEDDAFLAEPIADDDDDWDRWNERFFDDFPNREFQ
jgi:proteasome lid subunit RPN8/RPN11